MSVVHILNYILLTILLIWSLQNGGNTNQYQKRSHTNWKPYIMNSLFSGKQKWPIGWAKDVFVLNGDALYWRKFLCLFPVTKNVKSRSKIAFFFQMAWIKPILKLDFQDTKQLHFFRRNLSELLKKRHNFD